MKNFFKKNYTASQQINDNTCAIEQIATSLDNYMATTNESIELNKQRVQAEAVSRANGDVNLQNQITKEISARQSADQNLQQQINEIETGGTLPENLNTLSQRLYTSSETVAITGKNLISTTNPNNQAYIGTSDDADSCLSGLFAVKTTSSQPERINLVVEMTRSDASSPFVKSVYINDMTGMTVNKTIDLLKPFNDYINISASAITPVDNGGYMVNGYASRRLDATESHDIQWDRTPSTYILPLKSGNNVSFNVVEGNDGQLLEISSTGGSGGLDATTQLIVDTNPTYTHLDNELVVQYTARFRTGTQPPFTFTNDFTLTLPINITGTDGVVVDVAESGNAIEVHAERQKVTTTFANLFTELNTLTTQTKTIKSISFSPSKDISVSTNNFMLSSSGITTQTSTDIVFLSGQSYVLYPTQLPDPNNASYIFNLQGTGVRCGTMSVVMNSIQIQYTRFYLPTTDNLNIIFAETQTITTQISTESVVIEYE